MLCSFTLFIFPLVEPSYLQKNILNLKGSGPQVWQVNGVVREEGFGLFVGDRWVDDNILTLLPVDRGGDAVPFADLERVDDPEDFVKVATSGSGVRNGQTDDLLGVDDEHRSDGEGNALGVDVGGILVIQHVVQGSDLTFLVRDYGIFDMGWADILSAKLLNILDPSLVLFEAVGRETNDFHTTISKVFGATSNFAKLSGADRGKIIRMGEENGPFVPDPFVELYWALGGLSLEIRSDASKTQVRHGRRCQ